MSTTIDSLDIQITTSAGQAEVKIERLAEALGKLKANAGLTKVTNNLTKLAGALDTLNTSMSGMNNLSRLTTAMESLSNVQNLSGLASAIRTLKQLPEVVNGLDTSDLTRFEAQLESLSRALTPLATQIDTISTAFSRLPSRVSQVVTATNRMTTATTRTTEATERHGNALNTTGLNIMTAIHNFESMISVLNTVSDAISSVVSQAMEWDGIQYRFGRAFGEDAEEVYSYVQKINDAMGINIQTFMQYSSLYGSLLSGFGMSQEKITTISVGLTELSYDIWAAYNDRFESLEDASEAVRSAITGEIEPIRNAGIALTEASLQEYLDSVGMAEVSIENLSEAQKAEVRYAAMVEAAMNQDIVGTYASEMKTAEGAVRDLSQSFSTLTQSFGSLFIPIIQEAIPYVTAFVNALVDAVQWVANLFNITLFEIDWGDSSDSVSDLSSDLEDAASSAGSVGSGLSDAADAAEEIKDYVMGFDELNVISPTTDTDTSSSGSGSSGSSVDWGEGLELDTLWDDSVFAEAERQVDELKEKIIDWFEEWKTEIAIVAAALSALSIATMLGNLGEAVGLGEKFVEAMQTIKKIATTAIVIVLQYSFVHELLENFIKEGSWQDYIAALVVTAIGSGILYSQWGKGGLAIGLAVTAIASFTATFEDGQIDSWEEVVTGLTGIATAAGAVTLAWPTLKTAFDGIVSFFTAASQMAPEVGWLAALFPKLSSALAPVVSWISSAASAVGTFVAGISAPVWTTIAAVIAAIASVALFLARNWDEVVEAVKKFFKQNIAPKLEKIKGHFDKIVDAIQPLIKVLGWLLEPITSLIKGFAEWWDAAQPLTVLGEIFETIGGIIFSVVSGVIMGAIDMLIGVIENVIQYFSGIVQIISGVIDLVVALFSGGDIEAAFWKIINGVVDAATALWELVTQPISDFVNGVIDWFIALWDELVGHSIVPDTIDAIVEWFCSLPEKIFGPVQEFVDGIIKKFKDMWDDIKQWYNTNVSPKFTRAYWQNVFDKVVSGVSSKLAELKGAIAGKWQTVVDWYNTDVAPKLKLSYWTNKISGFLDVGRELVGNIREGLEEKWEKLKEWWEDLELAPFKIKSPHLTWTTQEATGWIKETLEALNLPTQLPKLEIAWYAQGGFPSTGNLFWASEAGPELVGTIGNRTAVANNDQIVAAVSQGVYSAVVAAMSSGGGNNAQSINVYLDGKQIYNSVKKVEAERGVSIMGNQLGYVY